MKIIAVLLSYYLNMVYQVLALCLHISSVTTLLPCYVNLFHQVLVSIPLHNNFNRSLLVCDNFLVNNSSSS